MKEVHATGYYCGHDLDAIEYTQELNTARGHTAEFVRQVLELVTGITDTQFYKT